LVQHGVRTVVSLQLDMRHAFESARLDARVARSVTFFRVREFPAVDVLTHRHLDERVAYVLAIINESPKPVFVSCRAGVDRTGIIAAAYRVLVEGMSPEKAIAEMEAFHSPWEPLNARYVRSLSGERKARILREVHEQEHRVPQSGEFVCTDGHCRFRERHHSATGLNASSRSPQMEQGAERGPVSSHLPSAPLARTPAA
jgi:hypothetical protein